MSTPSTKSKPVAPTARRAHEVSAKISQSCAREKASKLAPSLRRELRDVAIDTATYLRHRMASLKSAKTPSKAASDLARIQKEIETLNDAEKGEAEYTRLTVLERMVTDLRARVESEETRFSEDDALLNQEIVGFVQPFSMALSIEFCGDILDRACTALKPFCGDASPVTFAQTLPVVANAATPFHSVFNLRRSGMENARALISLIEKTVGN